MLAREASRSRSWRRMSPTRSYHDRWGGRPERLCNLSPRLPQFDRISLRVMQAGEPAVGISLRVNLDLDSRSLQLGRHFVEIPHSKVQHPNLLGIAEIFARLREGRESGCSCLLLPRCFSVA